jgi:modulator of FtsH protease HflC
MNRILMPIVLLGIVVVIVGSGAVYQVDETEQVIITQFGKTVGKPITTPGLHFKMPFTQTVRRFDKRIIERDGSPNQIPTLDKRFIKLDTTARWRIGNPLLFLQSVGDERSAQSRLDDLLDSAARDIVSSHLLIQAVRTFSRELPLQETEEGNIGDSAGSPATERKPEAVSPATTVQDIKPEERLGRDKLTELMVQRARDNLRNQFGIELIDVRIRRINYVQEVEKKVFERMISERRRIAARFRSEGDGASAKIRGDKERELDRLRSDAYRRAQEIIGRADAEAARIYAEAYEQDAEFFAFMQTLETYKQTLQKNSNLILSTESEFYRYLKNIRPPLSSSPVSQK